LQAQIDSLGQIAAFIGQQDNLLAGLLPLADVARGVSLATRAWQDTVRVTPVDSAGLYLPRLQIAGRGTGWAIQAGGVALTEPDDEKVAALEVEASVSLGPTVASADLRVRLSDLDRSLPARLDGAWERIYNGGADAGSQAANSLMELIDWTLRLLAPEADVLAWYSSEHRPDTELHEGTPTRALRLRYVVRNHPEKNSALNLYLKAVQELVGVIQSPKHALTASSEKTLAPVALTLEGLLHFLLVD
jgi:Predicted pPIWI-associating nuclease